MHHNTRLKTRYQIGITLLEIAIAVLILGFVLGSLPKIWIDVSKARNQLILSHSKAALKEKFKTYLLINGSLPCPDSDGDGYQNQIINSKSLSKSCEVTSGKLPYIDLAIQKGTFPLEEVLYETVTSLSWNSFDDINPLSTSGIPLNAYTRPETETDIAIESIDLDLMVKVSSPENELGPKFLFYLDKFDVKEILALREVLKET